MEVTIEEREDVIVTIIDGVTYELSREITGGQFMELRRKAIKPVFSENGEQTGKVKVDSVEFDFWNLFYRIVSPKMTKDEILALPRVIYQSLALLAGKMDNNEAQGVADFLRGNSSIFQTSLSTLGLSLDSPPATSDPISE